MNEWGLRLMLDNWNFSSGMCIAAVIGQKHGRNIVREEDLNTENKDLEEAKQMYSWAEREDQEIWNNGMFETVEDCIRDAIESGYIYGDTIYVGLCVDVEIGGIDLSHQLEAVEENMYDQVGEVSEGWDISGITEKRRSIYKLYEERLQELVKNYIREIGEEPVFYTITDIRPVVIE